MTIPLLQLGSIPLSELFLKIVLFDYKESGYTSHTLTSISREQE